MHVTIVCYDVLAKILMPSLYCKSHWSIITMNCLAFVFTESLERNQCIIQNQYQICVLPRNTTNLHRLHWILTDFLVFKTKNEKYYFFPFFKLKKNLHKSLYKEKNSEGFFEFWKEYLMRCIFQLEEQNQKFKLNWLI